MSINHPLGQRDTIQLLMLMAAGHTLFFDRLAPEIPMLELEVYRLGRLGKKYFIPRALVRMLEQEGLIGSQDKYGHYLWERHITPLGMRLLNNWLSNRKFYV